MHREIILRFPNAVNGEIKEIGSNNIIADSFELTQSICDEGELIFGGCIVGQMSIQVINIEQNINNRRVNVFLRQKYGTDILYPANNLYPADDLYPGYQTSNVEVQIFSGTIDSSLRQKNRSIKEIIAYDDLYVASKKRVFEYFKSIAMYSPTIKIGDLVESILVKSLNDVQTLFTEFNADKKLSLSYDLVKSVCNEKLTAVDLLSACCELNTCFAVIDRFGKIKFVNLLHPLSETIDYYSDLTFEEYTTAPINIVKFPYNKDKLFAYGHGADKQSWYISDNIITKCCTDISNIVMALNEGGNNYIFGNVYKYRPFTADIYARWWIEPGDKVIIKTGYNDTETVESFVFSRTLKGINGMKSNVQANGTEFLGKDEIENE